VSYQKKRCAFCDKPFDPSNGRARFCSVKCRDEQHAFLAKNTRSLRIEAKKLEAIGGHEAGETPIVDGVVKRLSIRSLHDVDRLREAERWTELGELFWKLCQNADALEAAKRAREILTGEGAS
jgi:hypothetical protein